MDTYDEKIKFSLLSILIKYAKWKLHIIYKCEKVKHYCVTPEQTKLVKLL